MPRTRGKPAPKRGRGRPRVRPDPKDREVLEHLCERLIAGESLHKICADKTMPAERSVYVLMATDDQFCRTIARAREAQQHAEIDKTIDLADTATPDNHQAVKLKIWARQWRAAKLMPKVYGDRITAEHTGAIGTYDLTGLSDEELDRLEGILGKVAVASRSTGGEG